MTWLNVLVHLAVMAYAVRAVCVRLREAQVGRDRRQPSRDHVLALQVGFAATAIAAIAALIADATDGGKSYVYVRTMWELTTTMCVLVAALAVRVMQHCRRMAHRSNKVIRTNGSPENGRS